MFITPDRPFDVPIPAPRLWLPGQVRSFKDQPMSKGQCFLCGCWLDRVGNTDEHVIPRWLQRKHGLWDQRMVLRNGTLLPYRQLTVPCCRPCQGSMNEALEKPVQRAFAEGYDAVADMHPYRLFQWLIKLSYGLLYRESSLHVSRRNPEAGFITGVKFLRRFQVQHILLQGVFRRVAPYGLPASIYLYKTAVETEPRLNFDFLDNFVGPFIGLRSNDIGIVAILQDWGFTRHVRWPQFERADPLQPLTAMQFKEVMASCLYQATLLKRPPRIRFWESVHGIYVRPESKAIRTANMFRPFQDSAFVRSLARATGWPLERLYTGDYIASWLTWTGEPMYREAEG